MNVLRHTYTLMHLCDVTQSHVCTLYCCAIAWCIDMCDMCCVTHLNEVRCTYVSTGDRGQWELYCCRESYCCRELYCCTIACSTYIFHGTCNVPYLSVRVRCNVIHMRNTTHVTHIYTPICPRSPVDTYVHRTSFKCVTQHMSHISIHHAIAQQYNAHTCD